MILSHRLSSRKFICTAVTIILFIISLSPCISAQKTSRRVLFLGNSVFYSRGGLFSPFEGFCREAGLDYQAVSQWHTPANPLDIEFLNYGRIPLNLPEFAADQEIHALIRSGQFDYVILEARRSGYLLPDGVGLPAHRGKFIPYEENLEALAAIHRSIVESGAQTVLYMHPDLQTAADIKHPLAQIYIRFHSDLEGIVTDGKKHEVILVPALFLWMDGVNRYGPEGWYADAGHGNALARYASACMLYTYLTGNDPRDNKFRELTELTQSWEFIPGKSQLLAGEEDSRWIKDQVWLYYSTWPQ